jgi:hypothetical protein
MRRATSTIIPATFLMSACKSDMMSAAPTHYFGNPAIVTPSKSFHNQNSHITPLVTPLQPEFGDKQVTLPVAYGSALISQQQSATPNPGAPPSTGYAQPLLRNARVTDGVRVVGANFSQFF